MKKTMSDDELKPCPLCDEPAVISHELTTTNVVYCGNPACPCNWHGMTEEVWNHRPEEERLQARIAELEAENERLREEIFDPDLIIHDKPKSKRQIKATLKGGEG